MALESGQDFRQWQLRFAQALRDRAVPARSLDIPDDRLEVYRQLIFNQFHSFISACFPVARQLAGPALWTELVRECLAEARPSSPLFRDLPEIFLDWFGSLAPGRLPEYPFFRELLHYEWIELKVLNDPQPVPPAHSDGIWRINPTIQMHNYQYPVQRIGPHECPAQPSAAPHHLVVFRALDGTARFVELSPLAALLVTQLREQPDAPVVDWVGAWALAEGQNPQVWQGAAMAMLQHMQEIHLLFGSSSVTAPG